MPERDASPESPDAGLDPRQRLAAVVREARRDRGWNQEQLAIAADVSEPTIQRYETGKTGTPDPYVARRVFKALGLDPRLIPVILGYVTAEEMGLPPEQPRVFTPTIERAIEILDDPKVSPERKAEWLAFLEFSARPGSAVNMTSRTDLQAG
jgi:transcriptional regulator with XRE-family HTH domain